MTGKAVRGEKNMYMMEVSIVWAKCYDVIYILENVCQSTKFCKEVKTAAQ